MNILWHPEATCSLHSSLTPPGAHREARAARLRAGSGLTRGSRNASESSHVVAARGRAAMWIFDAARLLRKAAEGRGAVSRGSPMCRGCTAKGLSSRSRRALDGAVHDEADPRHDGVLDRWAHRGGPRAGVRRGASCRSSHIADSGADPRRRGGGGARPLAPRPRQAPTRRRCARSPSAGLRLLYEVSEHVRVGR